MNCTLFFRLISIPLKKISLNMYDNKKDRMKKIIILGVFTSVIMLTACGQKENVPEQVKIAFEQKFPNASRIDWDKETVNEWEVEFKMDSKEYSANFDEQGNWKKTEYKIGKSDIPSAVKATLDKEFKDYKIDSSEIEETVNGKTYEFELEKGELDIDVVISPEGKVLKK